jgi:hypothetical protein
MLSAPPASSGNTTSLGSKKHERSQSIHIAVREEYTVSPTLTSLTQRMESPTRASGSFAGIGLLTLSIGSARIKHAEWLFNR